MAPLIILMYALFASSFSLGKVLVSFTTPLFLTGIRMFTAGIILIAYQFFWKGHRFHIHLKYWWLYLQIIVIGIYIAYGLRFWGLEYLSSSKTALIFNASPFFAAIYSYFFFDERITLKQWIGLIIGFLGLIPILITSSGTEQKIGEFLFISWPELAVLAAVAFQSYGWVIVRKLIKFEKLTPMAINGITFFFGGLLALITSPFIEGIRPIEDWPQFIGLLAVVIVISNIICYNLYGHLLKTYSLTFVSFAGFLVPIFAGLYGWGFLGETITWHFYASIAIVLFGLFLFYQDELTKTPEYY